MTDLVTQLRDARTSQGLTQREVAASMGTTQSAIARLEAGTTSPRLSTLEAYGGAVGSHVRLAASSVTEDVVESVAAALSRDDPDAALRAIIQFVADIRRSGNPVAALRREPAPTGDRRWDAAIAAAVAWVARKQGHVAPAWTAAPSKFLDGPWFPVVDILGRPLSPALAAYLLAAAPADFFGRGVLIDPASLESV